MGFKVKFKGKSSVKKKKKDSRRKSHLFSGAAAKKSDPVEFPFNNRASAETLEWMSKQAGMGNWVLTV